MADALIYILPLLAGWTLDLLFGDPVRLPHPVVWFGKAIAFGERHLNKGSHRKAKGALMATALIAGVFAITWLLRRLFYILPSPTWEGLGVGLLDTVIIFYCLAGTTLIREVRQVFLALDRSLEEGRRQVGRIVGRDTSELTAQEVRTAALETLAENLSDGVIAPLFWYALIGTPGMMAYKMVNTLDSMIGYKTPRYRDFGCWAAHIDDVANYIPARLTALLMIAAHASQRDRTAAHASQRDSSEKIAGSAPQRGINASQRWEALPTILKFVCRYGRSHASPNSGYPEAALAGILNCRFGGPHHYFGQLFDKPYIGDNDRPLTTADMQKAVRINRAAEVLAIVIITVVYCLT